MNRPLLTIGVLTFNRAHFLVQMLSSIQNQTFSNFIVRIFDNASTDDTEDVVRVFLNDPRFEYIKNTKNVGYVKNANTLIAECTTEYLLITHDDDIMLPTMIEKQILKMNSDLNINAVSVNISIIDSIGKIISESFYNEMSMMQDICFSINDFLLSYINDKNIIACPTVMLRTDTLVKNNLFFSNDAEKAADTLFWFNLNRINGFIYYINEVLFYYRKHDMQDSKNIFFIIPFLKKPVNELLKNDEELRLKWLKYINHYILNIIEAKNINIKNFVKYRNKMIVLNDISDFIIKFNLYILFYKHINLVKKVLKRIYMFADLWRNHD